MQQKPLEPTKNGELRQDSGQSFCSYPLVFVGLIAVVIEVERDLCLVGEVMGTS